jgi:AraC-like DNA-binding protein/quercetin dioxygenase-like cupin family protein
MPQRFYGPHPQGGIAHFHSHQQPLPEFPALTHVGEAVCGPTHFLHQHIHETFEICYIHAGRGEWDALGQKYTLNPGDLYIVKPGEVHGGRTDKTHPYHIFALGIDPSALPYAPEPMKAAARAKPSRKLIEHHKSNGVPIYNAPLRDISQAVDEAGALNDDFGALNERVIPGGQGIEQIYRRILAELDTPDDGNANSRTLKIMMVQALLVELLVFIARRYVAHRQSIKTSLPKRVPERSEIQELQAWLRSRLADPPALPEMAERVGLSPAHFAVVFKQETGMTPLEFVTSARIDEAGARLRSGSRVNVTDVALDLGFSSSQYFSLVFKRLKGCTPREWQKRD